MICPSGRGEKGTCPYIDGDDPRCASHFTLGQIDQAFALCLNDHERCSTYKRIQREANEGIQFIDVTCSIEPFVSAARGSVATLSSPLPATST